MRSYDKLFLTLFRINQHADDNQMSIQNLAIVFGPTLFGQAPVVGHQNGGVIADTPFQNLVSELLHVQQPHTEADLQTGGGDYSYTLHRYLYR